MSIVTRPAREAPVPPPPDDGGDADISVAAFRAELPELLRSEAGRWVAYFDGRRLRTAATQTELYRHCLEELGLDHDQFIVGHIAPDTGDEVECPLR